ncbi:MAG: multidrug efflux SMR transporter [Desulfomonile tiedjei]|nr:multidrug efflux SMR transporter [Desulfomonile tiedjei]
MKPWMFLITAIVLEVSGTTSMKLSEGFTKFWPSILIFVFYALSFIALTFCVKQMQISIAYAVWSGLGTFLIAIIGVAFFKEPMPVVKMLSLVLIIAGVLGVNLSGPGE